MVRRYVPSVHEDSKRVTPQKFPTEIFKIKQIYFDTRNILQSRSISSQKWLESNLTLDLPNGSRLSDFRFPPVAIIGNIRTHAELWQDQCCPLTSKQKSNYINEQLLTLLNFLYLCRYSFRQLIIKIIVFTRINPFPKKPHVQRREK